MHGHVGLGALRPNGPEGSDQDAPGRWGVSTGGNREQDPEDGRPRRGP